jgi:predicted O-methyltransferase YrrM
MKPMRTEHSRQGLRDMVRYIAGLSKIRTLTIVEIGAFTGDSTIIFAKNFKMVYSIDPFESGIGGINNTVDMKQIFKTFKQNIKGFNNIGIIKDFSFNAVKTFEDHSIDVVYIDGLHTYQAVKRDLIDWIPKIIKGGFCTGHDYHRKKFPGVVKAVSETIGNKIKLFKDTSWLKQV